MGRSKRNKQIEQRCPYCKRTLLAYRAEMTVEEHGRIASDEHIIPTADGGSDDPINRMITCQRCNNCRGHVPYEAWLLFCRTILQEHPNLPKHVIRENLQFFLYRLVEDAMSSPTKAKRAAKLTVLRLSEQVDGIRTNKRNKPNSDIQK